MRTDTVFLPLKRLHVCVCVCCSRRKRSCYSMRRKQNLHHTVHVCMYPHRWMYYACVSESSMILPVLPTYTVFSSSQILVLVGKRSACVLSSRLCFTSWYFFRFLSFFLSLAHSFTCSFSLATSFFCFASSSAAVCNTAISFLLFSSSI